MTAVSLWGLLTIVMFAWLGWSLVGLVKWWRNLRAKVGEAVDELDRLGKQNAAMRKRLGWNDEPPPKPGDRECPDCSAPFFRRCGCGECISTGVDQWRCAVCSYWRDEEAADA